MRTYNTTHPWISFRPINLQKATARFWQLLGEAVSKCEHIAGVPLRPSTAKELQTLYLAKGALASSAIEGNTLTEKEVLQHLEGKLKLPPSRAYLAREIDNIVRACNSITKEIASLKTDLTPQRICEFNRQVLDNLQLQEGVVPGEPRTHSVVVGNIYRGAPAEDVPYLLDQLCGWLASDDFRPQKGLELMTAVVKAVAAHLYLAWIHPFGDGNGRTARLIEFQILVAAGVPLPAAHLLSNHYNLTRSEYYRQLDISSKSGGDILPFLEYAVQGFVDGLREQLQMIRGQQWDVAWRNFIHEQFSEKSTASHVRRRRLVLDLSIHPEPVPLGKIVELTPRLAHAYARKTTKTLQRDVNVLVKMGLVERTAKGVRARREIILAFLPWRLIGDAADGNV